MRKQLKERKPLPKVPLLGTGRTQIFWQFRLIPKLVFFIFYWNSEHLDSSSQAQPAFGLDLFPDLREVLSSPRLTLHMKMEPKVIGCLQKWSEDSMRRFLFCSWSSAWLVTIDQGIFLLIIINNLKLLLRLLGLSFVHYVHACVQVCWYACLGLWSQGLTLPV